LREVFCPVIEFMEIKRTFAKVKGDNVDFFLSALPHVDGPVLGLAKQGLNWS
jgi:hypothetical protein